MAEQCVLSIAILQHIWMRLTKGMQTLISYIGVYHSADLLLGFKEHKVSYITSNWNLSFMEIFYIVTQTAGCNF
jgi:hypothetical protein